jgi:hypothetical protein
MTKLIAAFRNFTNAPKTCALDDTKRKRSNGGAARIRNILEFVLLHIEVRAKIFFFDFVASIYEPLV